MPHFETHQPGEYFEPYERERHTAVVKLKLATPRAVQECLMLLGLTWNPEPFVLGGKGVEPGLYAWVAAEKLSDDQLIDGGVIYWGIGKGAKGARARLQYEWRDLRAQEWVHAHGRAAFRLGARPVLSPVKLDPNQDLRWWNDESAVESFTKWLSDGKSIESKAELLAIRLAIHLGDVGAPVQSIGAGAWMNSNIWDRAAIAAARKVLSGPSD